MKKKTLHIRVDDELINRLEKVRATLEAETISVTIRALLTKAVEMVLKDKKEA